MNGTQIWKDKMIVSSLPIKSSSTTTLKGEIHFQFKQLINFVWNVVNQSTGSQLQIPPPIGIWLRQSVTEKHEQRLQSNLLFFTSVTFSATTTVQWMLDNAFNTIDLETKSKGPRASGASRAWSRWNSPPPQPPCPPFVGAPPTARRSPFQPTASPPQIPERIFYFWKLHFTMTGHRDRTLT